jgi:hypothetical protein
MKDTKLVLVLMLVVLLGGSGYGYLSYNWVGETLQVPSMEKSIIEGAGLYIKSNTDFQLFLREIELSGLEGANFAVLKELLNQAADNIELANAAYYQLWQASKNLAVDPIVLEKLNRFDYAAYQAQNNLNPTIFDQVAGFLKAGDISGAFERAYNATGAIRGRLETLEISVNNNTLPQTVIAECWRLNQFYVETQLFGQYVSEALFAAVPK